MRPYLYHPSIPPPAHPLANPFTHSPSLHNHLPTHPLTHSSTHPLIHPPNHPLTLSPTHSLTYSSTHPPHRGFLEAAPRSSSSNRLTISLPSGYLGDKRTSYGQRLFLNISLPTMAAGEEDYGGSLEIVSTRTRHRPVRLVLPLPPLQRDPQLVEVRRGGRWGSGEGGREKGGGE